MREIASRSQAENILRSEQYVSLPKIMVMNSVYSSLPSAQAAQFCEKNLVGKPHIGLQPRVVVVVGSGASAEACGLPTGRPTADFLRKEMNRRASPEMLTRDIRRLSMQYNLQEEDFETILLALSQHDRAFVLEKLNDIFGRRFHPWLGYEILAHLMKHRYLDAIINFNFDEILDQSIEDELSPHDYHKVILSGDCPNNVIDKWFDKDRGKFDLPIYLKPHGSATEPSSLRFTRDSYTVLPDSFLAIIERLLGSDRPVHVLVLGHAMQSVEFNHIIRRALKKRPRRRKLSFYFFERVSDGTTIVNRGISEFRTHMGNSNVVISNENILYSVVMEIIWKSIFRFFRSKHNARDIARHQLISRLFRHRWIEDWKRHGDENRLERERHRLRYFRDRTLVEIALSIAKAKGFASMSDLTDSRAAIYFDLYKRALSRTNLRDDRPIRSLEHACSMLGLTTYSFDNSGIVFERRLDHADTKIDGLSLTLDDFNLEAAGMIDKLYKELSIPACALAELREEFLAVLSDMHRGEEIEIYSKDSSAHALTFEQPEPLDTFLALRSKTEAFVSSREWDTLLCTTKSGGWLKDERFVAGIDAGPHRKIVMVVSDEIYKRSLTEMYGANNLEITLLPWWLNNRNVTLFIKRGKPMFGIYFERSMRISKVSPIAVAEPKDLEFLRKSFVAYWIKAQRFKADTFDKFISRETIDLGWADIVGLFGSRES
jgi:hypothetical protein